MGERYSHLSLEERCRLRGLMEMGLGQSEIARRLGRHRSTIDRELKRNRCAEGYRPDSAGRRAWARKLRGSRIARSTRLRAQVEDRLAMGWSPEQIAGRMELEGVQHRVCAESIYRHAYSPAGRRAPAIPNRTPIHQRPTKAHLRSELGHCEGDLMHFRRRRDILLTLQEWRSRLTRARRIRSKDAELTARAIVAELGGLPTRARRTIAHDNGGEFARHEQVTQAIGQRAYFCDPHSPWQRGGLENANGLLRCDLPRRTSLDHYTDADIDDLVWNLNATPRKCLGYRTPIKAFAINLGVALEM